jgi:hypothetical protein
MDAARKSILNGTAIKVSTLSSQAAKKKIPIFIVSTCKKNLFLSCKTRSNIVT